MAYFSAHLDQDWYGAGPERVAPQGRHHCPHCDATCPYSRPPNVNRPQAPRPAAHQQQAGPQPAPQERPVYYGTVPEGYAQPQPAYPPPNAPRFQGPLPRRGPPAEHFNPIPLFLTRLPEPRVPTVNFNMTDNIQLQMPASIYNGPDGQPAYVEVVPDARLIRTRYRTGRTEYCLASLRLRPRQRPQAAGPHADLGIDPQGNFSAPMPPSHGPRRARMARGDQVAQGPELRTRQAARRRHQETEEQQGEASGTQRDD